MVYFHWGFGLISTMNSLLISRELCRFNKRNFEER